MPFLNSNCVSSCHLTNERQSAAIRLGNAGPDNINNSILDVYMFLHCRWKALSLAKRTIFSLVVFVLFVLNNLLRDSSRGNLSLGLRFGKTQTGLWCFNAT